MSLAPMITAFCNCWVPHMKAGTDILPFLPSAPSLLLSTDIESPQRYLLNVYITVDSCLSWACSNALCPWTRGPLRQKRLFLLSDWGFLRAEAMSLPSDRKLPQHRLHLVGALCRHHLMVEKHFLLVHRIYTHHFVLCLLLTAACKHLMSLTGITMSL